MAAYTYSGQAVLADDDILENATGGTFVDAAGTSIPIYDLNNNPIVTISSNAFGLSSSFKANVPMGYIKFGSVLNRVFADEIAQFAVDAQGAVADAATALATANAALAWTGVVGVAGRPIAVRVITGSEPRPTGSDIVIWVSSNGVSPANAAAGDLVFESQV